MRQVRKKILGAAALIFWLGAGAGNAQTQADFFDDSVVHEVRLEIRPSDWERLKANFQENTYYPCNFEWRGLQVEDIAIRSRGRGSRSGTKPNLRVDFNRYEETRQFLGLKAFHLKANNEDASFLKERLTMLFFRRMGIPASREAHARLYVNGQYVGLYLVVEELNKEFLKRNFDENEGYLYEWKPPEDPYHFEYLGSDPSRYSPLPFDPKTHETDPEPRPLEAMIRTINQASNADFPRAAAEYLDLKLFVTHVAIENFLSEADGILGDILGMNNFYLYRFKGKNLSQLIPWDKDHTFAASDREIFKNANANVLMRRALAIPEVRSAYLEALAKSAVLAGGPDGWLSQEIAREYDQIRTAAREDPFKMYQAADGFLKPSSEEVFFNEASRVSQFAGERTAEVLRQVAAAGFRPSAEAPSVNAGGVVNLANGAVGVLTLGSVVSLYGERLSNTTAEAATQPSPTTLGGVSVYIDGFAAPLLFVSPTQINVKVPREIRPGSVSLSVIANGTLGNTLTVNALLP